MLYHYIASDKSEKTVEADFEADNLDNVLRHLSSMGLKPASIKPIKAERQTVFRHLFGKITVSDKMFLTRYLSLMLRVGSDLLSAISILIYDFDKPAMRNLLLEIRENISRGQLFYKAFEAHPKTFSTAFINLIRAGEASGNLQETFENLSVSLAREAELRSNIRSALIYPVVLLSIALVVIVFLVTFALPRVAGVFAEGGIETPAFSRVVFAIGLFMGDNVVALLSVLLGVVAFMIIAYYRTSFGKRLVGQVLSKTPLIRDIYRNLAIQRMASTMRSLMKAGLPIVETINIAAATVGSFEFKYSLERIANDGLAKGLTIGEAFKREVIFPKVVTNTIAISEKSGHLEEVLATLADFYASNINSSIKTLLSLLEPILLLFMALIVGTIALSIVIPIYQLSSQF